MVRRVVTGHDGAGRSIVVSDEQVEGMPIGSGGSHAYPLWGRDDPAAFPDDGAPPVVDSLFPPVGGCRCAIVTIGAGATREFDEFVSTALAEFADPDVPGMHRTASLDFDVVLSGSVVLELDDGIEVELGPGDVVVQNGTRHRWHNRSDAPATYASIVVGATNSLVA